MKGEQNKMTFTKEAKYIAAVLANDEVSTDQELISLFVKEMKMSEKEAKYWVSKRNDYLGAGMFS